MVYYDKKAIQQKITGEHDMDTKHYTEVLIDGRIYTLGGTEDEGYMQRVASYINEMITTLKRQEGFTKQSAEYQTAW